VIGTKVPEERRRQTPAKLKVKRVMTGNLNCV